MKIIRFKSIRFDKTIDQTDISNNHCLLLGAEIKVFKSPIK